METGPDPLSFSRHWAARTFGWLLASAVWLSPVIGSAASPPVCGLTKLQQVEVGKFLEPGSMLLQDGRSIRLAGVHFPAGQPFFADQAISVKLFISTATKSPDRYGRWPVYAYSGPERSQGRDMLQAILLQKGQALARPRGTSQGCAGVLLLAEKTARQARSGLWANASNWFSQAKDKDLALKAGRFQIVEGRVVSVGETRRTIYLNFGKNWKRDFTVTVAKRDAKRFKDKIRFFKSLAGRKVRVRGWMQARDGALIRVSHAGQIELAAD